MTAARGGIVRTLILLVSVFAAMPAFAENEHLLDGLNGNERSRVETIARGGSVWNPTAKEKALALAIGGGTAAERSRMATISRGGSVWGMQDHEKAASLMTGGGNGSERSRIDTLRRGGSLWGMTKAEKIAGGRRR
jgi:hypothetical protein